MFRVMYADNVMYTWPVCYSLGAHVVEHARHVRDRICSHSIECVLLPVCYSLGVNVVVRQSKEHARHVRDRICSHSIECVLLL